MAEYIKITNGVQHAEIIESAFPGRQRFGWGLEPEPEEEEEAEEPEAEEEEAEEAPKSTRRGGRRS